MTNPFPRNRYDAREFTSKFDASELTRDGGEVCVVFGTSHELTDEFTIYFPSCEDKPSKLLMDLARSLCSRITELDNLVQDSNEIECERNGHKPEDYELYLAYAKVEEKSVELEYFGTHVNTQWTAQFSVQADGHWKKANF